MDAYYGEEIFAAQFSKVKLKRKEVPAKTAEDTYFLGGSRRRFTLDREDNRLAIQRN